MILKNVLTISAVVCLCGCVGDPKYVEEDFGSSVRQMVAAQIYDPVVASNPDLEPPLIVDGVVIDNGVQGYRERSEYKEEDDSAFTFILQ